MQVLFLVPINRMRLHFFKKSNKDIKWVLTTKGKSEMLRVEVED